MTALLDRTMLALADDDEPAEDIAPDHLDAVLEGLRQVEQGCFATPAEVEAVFARSPNRGIDQ